MKMKSVAALLILVLGLIAGCQSASEHTVASAPEADVKGQAQFERATIKVSGTYCVACMVGIRRSLERIDGVQKVDARETDVVVEYDPRKVAPSAMVKAVEELGFKATL